GDEHFDRLLLDYLLERFGVSVGDVVLESVVLDDEYLLHAVPGGLGTDRVHTLAENDRVTRSADAAGGLFAGLDCRERGLREFFFDVLSENQNVAHRDSLLRSPWLRSGARARAPRRSRPCGRPVASAEAPSSAP